ncbi:hypothetical protein B296_00043854 [Ensete ventricosum]|uniref:Uncharacterized protein n=1 Tax=Ensete ventricosum TaxID=4639 RepID=A0A426YB45_ENSVE|nr:hypothetical protein B296_00043854 [Ensete ventricosum]
MAGGGAGTGRKRRKLSHTPIPSPRCPSSLPRFPSPAGGYTLPSSSLLSFDGSVILFRCRRTPAFLSPCAAAAAWTRRYRLRRPSSCSIPSSRCSAVSLPYVSATGTDAVVIPCRSISSSIMFMEAAKKGNLVPLYQCIFSDHLTPVQAYRCLVKEDDREAPSFLFESVEQGLRGTNVVRPAVLPSSFLFLSLLAVYGFSWSHQKSVTFFTSGYTVTEALSQSSCLLNLVAIYDIHVHVLLQIILKAEVVAESNE